MIKDDQQIEVKMVGTYTACEEKRKHDVSTQKDCESEVDDEDEDESEGELDDNDFIITFACRRSCFIAWTKYGVCCHGSGFTDNCDTECRRRVASMRGCRHAVLLCQLCSRPRLECSCDGTHDETG